VRRFASILLYVVGYSSMALFDAHAAFLPAVASFCAASGLLVRFSEL
jgi:hypothetical protein